MDYIRRMRDLQEGCRPDTGAGRLYWDIPDMYARYERGANELPIHHLIKLL